MSVTVVFFFSFFFPPPNMQNHKGQFISAVNVFGGGDETGG